MCMIWIMYHLGAGGEWTLFITNILRKVQPPFSHKHFGQKAKNLDKVVIFISRFQVNQSLSMFTEIPWIRQTSIETLFGNACLTSHLMWSAFHLLGDQIPQKWLRGGLRICLSELCKYSGKNWCRWTLLSFMVAPESLVLYPIAFFKSICITMSTRRYTISNPPGPLWTLPSHTSLNENDYHNSPRNTVGKEPAKILVNPF